MNYSTMSFRTLRNLYTIHLQLAMECPNEVTESDHAERHAIAMELDRRNEGVC